MNRTGRTILYYPTIDIPNKRWMKQALLYWDNISSIIPVSLHMEGSTLSEDLIELGEQGIYIPVFPEDLYVEAGYRDLVEDFRSEFLDIASSDDFRSIIPEVDTRVFYNVHPAKFFGSAERVLKELQLRIRTRGLYKKRDRYSMWIEVEGNTALLFMALLAKYLAYSQENITIPGTDNEAYWSYSYFSGSSKNKNAAFELLFDRILPVPREDVSIKKILRFRENRRDELIRLRKLVDVFSDRLSNTENREELKSVCVQAKEDIELGLIDLANTLKDAKIQFTLTALNSLIDIKEPSFLIAVGALTAAKAAGLITVPVTIGGIALAGAIKVGLKYANFRRDQRQTFRNSPYAYLYHAEKDKITGG